jgi:gamma-glutamyltranspeptidase/glutathione hydrolase
VAAGFPEATDAGIEVLREGGNAMDAAVAAAWALGVCEPSASGLGGHTVMLVRFADGRTVAIDGSSRGPAAASIATITASDQERGYRSCTVPSTPATLDWAQRRYGALSRERVMAPAIRIAHEGYEMTPLQHRQTRWVAESLRATLGGQLFLHNGAASRSSPPRSSGWRASARAISTTAPSRARSRTTCGATAGSSTKRTSRIARRPRRRSRCPRCMATTCSSAPRRLRAGSTCCSHST